MSDLMTLLSAARPQLGCAGDPGPPAPAQQLTLPSFSSTPTLAPAGFQFGRYRVEECLGLGGMGAVYRAYDTVLGRRVALKTTLSPGGNEDINTGLRFLREAEVMAKLEHPHVVRIFDVGLHEGTPYLVMEYLEGQHLGQMLTSKRRLPLNRALGILFPVLAAVDFAHCAGVLHHDLKPTNLFVTQDHLERLSPRILDFGICLFSGVAPELDPTREDYAGTPAYMPPESLNGDQPTPASDIFSLGVILYECLSSINPFAKMKTLVEIKLAITEQRYPPINALCPHLPSAVAGILQRAMNPDPNERFHSAREFGEALCAVGTDSQLARWAGEFRIEAQQGDT